MVYLIIKPVLLIFLLFMETPSVASNTSCPQCEEPPKTQEITDEEIIEAINKDSTKKERFIAWLLREKLISRRLLTQWLTIKENRTEDRVKVRVGTLSQYRYIPLKEIKRVQNLMVESSLDELVFPDNTETRTDVLVDHSLTPEELLASIEEERNRADLLSDVFNDVLNTYPRTANTAVIQRIFYERIIASEKPTTLRKIATEHGISLNAVYVKEQILLKKLK